MKVFVNCETEAADTARNLFYYWSRSSLYVLMLNRHPADKWAHHERKHAD